MTVRPPEAATEVATKATPETTPPSRRDFIRRSTAAVAGGLAAHAALSHAAYAGQGGTLQLGLVGCGGRGTGAARQALLADEHTRLTAVADAFEDKAEDTARRLGESDVGQRVEVGPDRRYAGFDAYKRVIEAGVDVVLLATPPHFRPMHLQACIEAGKHVFAEKPVAVDAPGVRSVLETTELARRKGLYIVSGLNSRYSFRMQETMQRVQDGQIGEIVAIEATRYHGGVWVRPRRPEQTEMQYQMRNWYYFTWLSGDFNVEQFVHQYDQIAWALGDRYPDRCHSNGGRIVRTGPEHGHIYDHFNTVFEYEGGPRIYAGTRHWDGCDNEFGVRIMGTEGACDPGRGVITGRRPWRAGREEETDSHQLEHDAFFAALREGEYINNGDYMARSTMMGIMARMSAYTGRSLTWEQAMGSEQALDPEAYAWDAAPPPAEVAIPGKTEFV